MITQPPGIPEHMILSSESTNGAERRQANMAYDGYFIMVGFVDDTSS